jgi:ADP-ribosyl-[dinitrogen reductase] hydrolase
VSDITKISGAGMTISLQSRIEGAVLGAAIGDAMGHPTEFISSFDGIIQKYGPHGITGFELSWTREGKRFAPYTDDTQMAEVVLRTLVESRKEALNLDTTMKLMADGFIAWSNNPQGGHRAPGRACLEGCLALQRGVHWSKAGGATAGGCGSVMRAYPFGLIFHDEIDQAEHWAVEHSGLTHRDPIALAACAAMGVGVAQVLRDESVKTVTSDMVNAARRYSPETADMIEQAVHEAGSGIEPKVTLQRLRGWAAHEAIAAGAYIFVRHADDPRAAILEGANTPGDSDSIATLAGALTGARCGVGSIPVEWIRDVERGEELLGLAGSIVDVLAKEEG